MSYGIEILNTNSRVQIDQNFSNMFISSSGTASRGTAFPPSAFSAGDMVIARATGNGYCSVAYDNETNNRYEFGDTRTSETYYDDASFYSYKIISPFAGNVSAATSGYGLEVFTSSGDVAYSTKKTDFVKIAALGTIPGNSTLRFPASGTIDLSKHFCLMANGIQHYYIEISFEVMGSTIIQTFEYVQSYEYVYTSGSNGYINIDMRTRFDGQLQTNLGGSMDYCIFKLVD